MRHYSLKMTRNSYMLTKAWHKRAILISSLAMLATNKAIAQVSPNYSAYNDCRNGRLSDGAKAHSICFKDKNISRKELGTAVDGDSSKRLVIRGLRKVEFKEDDHKNVVIYELSEMILDCKSNLIKRRTQITAFSGSTLVKREPTGSWETTESSKEQLRRMQAYCPADPGYTRIGNGQIKIQGLLRAGSRVNSILKTEKGELPISIDCRRLTISAGNTEDPIKPGSNGQKIYEALCK